MQIPFATQSQLEIDVYRRVGFVCVICILRHDTISKYCEEIRQNKPFSHNLCTQCPLLCTHEVATVNWFVRRHGLGREFRWILSKCCLATNGKGSYHIIYIRAWPVPNGWDAICRLDMSYPPPLPSDDELYQSIKCASSHTYGNRLIRTTRIQPNVRNKWCHCSQSLSNAFVLAGETLCTSCQSHCGDAVRREWWPPQSSAA